MKKIFKKKKMFLGLMLATLATSSLILPTTLTSCSNNEDKTNNNNNQTEPDIKPDNFQANIDQIKNSISYPALTTFDPSVNSSWKVWDQLDSDPNNPVYAPIFNKITPATITNDIKQFLVKVANVNNTFALIHVDDFNITKNNQNFKTSITLNVKNTNSFNREFKINQFNQKIIIKSQQILPITINIDSPIIYEFYKTPASYNSQEYNLRANYYFASIALIVNNQTINISNANFNGTYSSTLNTLVPNVNIAKNYKDIEMQGNDYLNSLTIDKIQNEIYQKINNIIDLVKNVADDAQTILQAINKNELFKDFLTNNSKPATNILVHILKYFDIDISSLQPIIIDLLNDKTIFEILNSPTNKQLIDKLINILPDGVQETAKTIIDKLTSPAGFEELLGILNQEPIKSILGPELIESFHELSSIGLITFIFKNIDAIKNLLLKLNLNINNIIETIYPLIKMIANNYLNQSQGVITDLLNILRLKDDQNNYVLNNIINLFIKNPNPLITDLLNQLVYNNANLNEQTLKNFIGVIANPYTDVKATQIVRYSDWLKNIKITPVFASTNSYNNQTHQLNLKFNLKYEFGSDIYFKISDIYAILPSSININSISIPISVISSLLPKWFGFKQNDYVEYIQNNENITVNYDVVKRKKKNYLTWNIASNDIINLNLPQSLQIISENCKLPTNAIKQLLNDIFYHQFNVTSIFQPEVDLNNPTIDSYNYESYNNQAILTKPVDKARKDAIKQEILNVTKTSNIIPEEKYEWKNGWKTVTIYKTETNSTFNLNQALLDELFDFSNFKNKYTYQLEVTEILAATNITLPPIAIPSIYIVKIKVFSNTKFYSNNAFGPVQTIEIQL